MSEIRMKPIPAESVQVLEKPEMTVADVRHTAPCFGDEELFHRLYTKL